MLLIKIPGDPVAKARPRFVRATGRTYTPAKTVAAERSIAQFAAEAMRGRPLLDSPLAVILDCAFLWPKSITKKRRADPQGFWKDTKPDHDNLIKILDALNKVVWTDDGKVCLTLVRKYYSDLPMTTIRVYPLAEGELLLWPIPSSPAERLETVPEPWEQIGPFHASAEEATA